MRERERERARVEEEQRETERILIRVRAVSTEPDAALELMNCELRVRCLTN